jgi:hypothetical protein
VVVVANSWDVKVVVKANALEAVNLWVAKMAARVDVSTAAKVHAQVDVSATVNKDALRDLVSVDVICNVQMAA